MSSRFQLFGLAPAALLALALFAPTSYATNLNPGDCVGLGTLACPGAVQDFAAFPGVIKADTGLVAFTGVDALGNTRFTGEFEQIVLLDGVTGHLDFIYQFRVLTGDSIGSLTTINYKNVTTDVGYDSAQDIPGSGFTGTFAPTSVQRSSGTGDVVTFDFHPGKVPAGTTTYSLIIKTNSDTYAFGSTSVIDGGIANIKTYDPTPEPMNAGLLLGGLFGAGLLVARKFQAKKA